MSRNKGKRWEQEVARMMRAIFGDHIKRGWQSREGDDDPDIVGVPKFWIECKRHKRTNFRAALRQAESACPGDHMPLAICRDDPGEGTASVDSRTYAVMYYKDFENFLRMLAKHESK
tara:strand:- start:797 stop:1147 length:351 start_codon:yes stop_codon:yes gene_type:complete